MNISTHTSTAPGTHASDAFALDAAVSRFSSESATQSDRDFIANILLLAVFDSQGLDDRGNPARIAPDLRSMHSARRWLLGPLATLYFLHLDINPEAVADRLRKKWAWIDADVDAADGGQVRH
ncbi:hypothetical protein HAP94_07965 [Acidithiobacillus ferrivorans]|nr:hypothetical protein [Acidithiobacillus ferrivorans]